MTRASIVDRVMQVMTTLAGLSVVAVLLWIVADMVGRGAAAVSWSFVAGGPSDSGRSDGIWPIVVSTLLVKLVALLVAVPLAVATAAYLSEFTRQGSPTSRLIARSMDVLAATPSIVFGLFGMVLFGQWLGLGYSILTGGLTLACMVLPVMMRTTQVALCSVPAGLRLGASALALSRSTALFRVFLPAAAHGVLAGIVLGGARVVAETAALIFTSGYVVRLPTSLLDSGRTLSVHIYDLAMNVPGGEPQAYASGLVLMGVVLGIHGIALGVRGRWLANGGDCHDSR